jgi:hypothetical protein
MMSLLQIWFVILKQSLIPYCNILYLLFALVKGATFKFIQGELVLANLNLLT